MKHSQHIILGLLVFSVWVFIAEVSYLSWLPYIPLFDFVSILDSYTYTKLLLSLVLVNLILVPLTRSTKKNLILLQLLNNGMLVYLSLVLFILILPVAIPYTLVKLVFYKGVFNGLREMSDYLRTLSHSIDQTGNSMGMWLFSDLFINTGKGKQFGSPDETISHVTGSIKRERLTWLGVFLHTVLETVDPGHNENAKNKEQWNENIKKR